MTNEEYNYFSDLVSQVAEIPPDTIVSRTLYKDNRLKAILFGFAPGQELSEHTASVPAIIHILEGEAQILLGEDGFQAEAGTWIHMTANLPHSIQAQTQVKMLLIMLQ
jgi:quercetin dioxygenase-like cupin family protein